MSTTSLEIEYLPKTQTVVNGHKCSKLYLGGIMLEQGMTESSMKPRSCSSLKCFQCDKKVHRYANASWNETVDYLFVRNNNTNLDRLREGLDLSPGNCAYSCQCKFITVEAAQDEEVGKDLNWMCGGH